MTNRRSILNAVLVAVIILAAGAALLVWRHQQRAAQVLRGVPKVPDLSRWPEAFSRQIHDATASAKAAKNPIEPLGRLASLYLANAYAAEARQVLGALRVLEPANARWAYLLLDAQLRLGDNKAAEKSAQDTVRLDPGCLPAWFRLGSLRLQRGEIAEARDCYARAVAAAPKDVTAACLLLRFDAKRGGGGGLRAQLAALTQAHPDIKQLHAFLAELHTAAGDFVGSAQERRLETVAKLEMPNEDPWIEEIAQFSYNPDTLRGLARCAAAEGRFATAQRLMKRALELPSLDPELLGEFGRIYEFMSLPGDALQVLQLGVTRCPKDPGLRAELARKLSSRGQFDEAMRILRQALETWPANAGLHAAMGIVLADARKSELAVAELREAIRLDSTQAEAYWNLAACLIDLGQKAEGRAAAEAALVIRPDYVNALLLVSRMALEDGDLAAAGPAVQRLFALSPSDSRVQMLFGWLHVCRGAEAERAGNTAVADDLYRAGLEVSPGYAPLWRAKGTLKFHQDRFEEAVIAFQSCVRLEPQNPSGYLFLGQALQKTGRLQEATNVLEAGLELAEKSALPAAVEGFKKLLGR